MSKFTRSIDELTEALTTTKNLVVRHLTKNYKENVHYIVEKHIPTIQHGGQNKINYLLTEKTFELIKHSYNLRNKYITKLGDNIEYINPICMCIENQTIGFIENSFRDVVNLKRQYRIGKYRIDLYFVDYKLAIECDENNHSDRDIMEEKTREDFILSLGNKIIRYNPNETGFDLSNVLRQINHILFTK